MKDIAINVAIFLFIAALIVGLAYMMTLAMPVIHAECRTRSAQSLIYHSEGLCFGAYE